MINPDGVWQVWRPQVRSESYLLVCAEGTEGMLWTRHCTSELSWCFTSTTHAHTLHFTTDTGQEKDVPYINLHWCDVLKSFQFNTSSVLLLMFVIHSRSRHVHDVLCADRLLSVLHEEVFLFCMIINTSWLSDRRIDDSRFTCSI